MSSFRTATEVQKISQASPELSAAFSARVPDGWQQGPGAFGGLVLATLLRAMQKACPDAERRLRTLTGEICVPVLADEVRIETAILRNGKRVTYLDSHLLQSNQLVARASAAFAKGRASDAPHVDGSPPTTERVWSDAPLLPMGPPLAPVFTQHYEYRSTGPLPFSGGKQAAAVTEGWVRERNATTEPMDECDVVGLIDAWWPAVLATMDTRRPFATLSFTMQLFVDAQELRSDEPLHYRGTMPVGRDGYYVEMRELWHQGKPVAFNQQTFVLVK